MQLLKRRCMATPINSICIKNMAIFDCSFKPAFCSEIFMINVEMINHSS